ncbi:MAG: WecB/TagA/CpsF family glycosyltransferase [Fuerstiella sp.]
MSIRTDFQKQRLFGIDFDVVTMRDAVDWIFRKVAIGRQSHCRFVVTPNVNLTLRHQNEASFRRLIHHADLTICDGQPLVRLSRWFKKPLPERVAGSDLVFQIFEAAVSEMPVKVFLLGAAPGVAEVARDNIYERWEAVEVVGTCSPDFGFEKDAKKNEQIVQQINDSDADILIIGLGAPKQEAWAFDHRFELNTAVALCVGGTIDFLAGEQTRAPSLVRRVGLEWVWRIATNPGRLAKRYLKDSLRLPGLILDQWSHLCPCYDVDIGVDGESREIALEDAAREKARRAVRPAVDSQNAILRMPVALQQQESQNVARQSAEVATVEDEQAGRDAAGRDEDCGNEDRGVLLFADYLRSQKGKQVGK